MNGFRDGIVGFFLFFAHWLSPQTEKALLNIDFLKYQNNAIVYRCKMDMAWNKQLEQLVDAGIPLSYNICYFSDKSDTIQFFRTLHFNMVDYTYNYVDSSHSVKTISHNYSLIHLALRDFCKWEIIIPNTVNICRVEVTILPSKADQFDRVVDMSRVWGQQRVFTVFSPKDKIPARKSIPKEVQ